MAVTVQTSTAWTASVSISPTVSPTFSPDAGTLLVAVLSVYDATSTSVTNSGTGLTWTRRTPEVNLGLNDVVIYTAWNASAQSNITVTASASGGAGGFPIPNLKVYALAGVDSGSPVNGATEDGTSSSDPLSLYLGSGITTTTDGGSVVAVVQDRNYAGTITSSNADALSTELGTWYAASGIRAIAPSTSVQSTLSFASAGSPSWAYAAILVNAAAGGTSHTADASRSTTVSVTAAANLSASASATRSTTATLTAAATVERVTTAAVSTTATLTAAASRETFAAASVAETVTITASADVTPAAGNVTADAVLSVTDTITAAATLTGVAAASVAETVTITASATVERFAAAALSITGTLTASATIPGQEPTTPGFMRGVEVVGPTIRPAGGPASVPRIVALIGFNAATMTAVLSTTATPSRLGVPLFSGGSVNPVEAGLIAAGLEYYWFTDAGEIYHETGD